MEGPVAPEGHGRGQGLHGFSLHELEDAGARCG